MSMLNKNNISLKTNYSIKMMPLSVLGISTIEQDQIAKIIKNNKYTNRTFTIAFK